MIDFRPISFILGILVSTLAVMMLAPAAVDFFSGNQDWEVFAVSASVTFFIGISLVISSRAATTALSVRGAFILTTLSWVVLTLFAALPFSFAQTHMSFSDSFFEAMSGITTTGATVMFNLDTAPPGLLLWRSLLQWLGGIGIIVMALAVLPFLRVGGMQLFRMESSDQADKALPRTAHIAAVIGAIYLGLTIFIAFALYLAGLSGFDSITHAMTTIATGGFSNHDSSFSYFDNYLVELITVLGMVLGSLPFLLYLSVLQGKYKTIIRDSQVRWFLAVLIFVVVFVTIWLWAGNQKDLGESFRMSLFNVVSIMTGTGFKTEAFDSWGSFSIPIFFFIMFIGGCAGSTTCGIKIFRFQVLYAAAKTQFENLAHPHGVFIPYYNGNPISDEVIKSVMSFFFVFGMTFALLAVGLALMGIDFLTAVSAAASAISNVGPGLGPIIGPEGNYSSLPDSAKWLLSAGMLLGRLELFTVIVLFTRAFWKA